MTIEEMIKDLEKTKRCTSFIILGLKPRLEDRTYEIFQAVTGDLPLQDVANCLVAAAKSILKEIEREKKTNA